jgi:hypothetical protein
MQSCKEDFMKVQQTKRDDDWVALLNDKRIEEKMEMECFRNNQGICPFKKVTYYAQTMNKSHTKDFYKYLDT